MPPKRRAKTVQKQPFNIGFHIYIAPFYFNNSPGSTRIICSAYHFKARESPLTNNLYLERNKILAEHQTKEENMKFILKYKQFTAPNRDEFVRIFEEDIESPFEANIVTGFKGMKFKADTKVIIKLYNEKDRELIKREILYAIFKDLIIDPKKLGYTNNTTELIDQLVDTTDEEIIIELIKELQKADLDIYGEYESPTDEEIEDSNQRMYSRAVAIYTALSVTEEDIPDDGETIALDSSDFEDLQLHEIALFAAIDQLKDL